jgi:hypothetical protein
MLGKPKQAFDPGLQPFTSQAGLPPKPGKFDVIFWYRTQPLQPISLA